MSSLYCAIQFQKTLTAACQLDIQKDIEVSGAALLAKNCFLTFRSLIIHELNFNLPLISPVNALPMKQIIRFSDQAVELITQDPSHEGQVHGKFVFNAKELYSSQENPRHHHW